MSSAAPRSCLKPPPRNPWVAEDGGESSTSSSQQNPQNPQTHPQNHPQNPQDNHSSHDLLAHQYATPFQAAHSLAVSYSGHGSSQHTQTAARTHTIAHTTAAHPTAHPNSAHPNSAALHPNYGVVHSHTAHSLHSAARHQPSTTQSVHSVPGTLQQPWMDQHILWGMPGGVYTVGAAGPEGACQVLPPGLYAQTHALHPGCPPGGGGSSGQASSSCGGTGWGVPPPQHTSQHSGAATGGGSGWGVGGGGGGCRNISGVEGSRCERCHYYCFRLAQILYVIGIITGFSLLVAGGIFHGQRVAHLQVLVYIGALISLVCVVLLVIFCAMNKDHRTSRRGIPARFSGPQVVIGDPETVPLRSIDVNNPIVIQGDLTSQKNNHSGYTTHGTCLGQAQPVCYVGTSHTHTPDSVLSNHATDHMQSRNQSRTDDECEGNHRYNRLWKQPNKASNEAASKL